MRRAGAWWSSPPRPPERVPVGGTLAELSAVTVRRGRREILSAVDVTIRAGEVVALVGPNGAGKSTLLGVLGGDLVPHGGVATVHDRPLAEWSAAELAMRRAVLPQQLAVSFPFTAAEVVRMGRAPWARTPAEDDDEAAIAEAMADVDVAHLTDRLYSTLSGGERARVSLARVLAQRAQLVLLDEPTAALDVHHQELVLERVLACSKAGDGVVVVVHDLALAAAYADRVVVLDGGVVHACGPTAQVMVADLLSRVYQHDIDVFDHPLTGQPIVTARRRDARSDPLPRHARLVHLRRRRVDRGAVTTVPLDSAAVAMTARKEVPMRSPSTGPIASPRAALARTAAAALLSLGAVALTTAATSDAAGAVPVAIGGGSLTWGVKESFRTYVVGPIAHGSIGTVAPAARTATGLFTFPATGGTYDGPTTIAAAFGGGVHFVGHDAGNGPLLDMAISDVRIEVSGSTGVLVADVASTELTSLDPSAPVTPPIEYPDTPFAALDLTGLTPIVTGGAVTWSSVPARLTTEGVPAFGGFYAAGQVLDAVTFTVSTAPVSPPSGFVPVVPGRVLDTRVGGATVDGAFAGGGVVAAGGVVELVVGGRGGVPVDASAVVVNVTVTDPSGWGYVTVWPCGSAPPNASSVNFVAGQTVANAVVAKVGVGAKVCLQVAEASAQLIVDVTGHFGAGGGFVPVVPGRVLDTRVGGATVDGAFAGGGVVAAGGVVELVVGGRGGVPVDASAVVVNVTVTDPSGWGYVTVWPCGSAPPNASSVNFVAGQTVANAVVAKVGVGAKVCLQVAEASAQLIVDVTGHFGAGGGFVPVVPGRVLDTRVGGATVDGAFAGGGVVAAGGVVELVVGGRGGVPVDASAVVVNVTVTDPSGWGYVTVWPCGSAPPNASSVNFVAGQTVANAVVAKVGVGAKVCLQVAEASAQLIVDVTGHFGTV